MVAMDRDTALAAKVGVALVVLLLLAMALWNWREKGRPLLREVRVVAAVHGSDTFRDGTLSLEPGQEFELAVALRLQERDAESYWISPAAELVLEGEAVEHRRVEAWPEGDRSVRVHWFTIESSLLGGEVTTENAAKLLAYRTFLAPALGRSMRVRGLLEPSNDNHLGADPTVTPFDCGTLRFYARVEVVEAMSDVRPLQAASSLGPDLLWDPRLPVVRRRLAVDGLDPSAGELFLLPGLTPGKDDVSGRITDLEVADRELAEWVESRLAVSSWTFAAVALTGSPRLTPDGLRLLGTVRVVEGQLLRDSRGLRWGQDVLPGDLLASGPHWTVVVADDGNGILDLDDLVAHCWRRPPRAVSLLAALEADVGELRHLRREH